MTMTIDLRRYVAVCTTCHHWQIDIRPGAISDHGGLAPAMRAMMPQRIQRQRVAGWRMPEGAIYVGRPTKWGNPYRVGAPSAYWTGPGYASPFRPAPIPLMDAVEVTGIYRQMVLSGNAIFDVEDVRRDLAGHDLACWCPLDQACHADVLLELANG